MLRYVLAKLALTIPLLLGVTFLLFVIGQLTPGPAPLYSSGASALHVILPVRVARSSRSRIRIYMSSWAWGGGLTS